MVQIIRPIWDPEVREPVIDSIKGLIRKFILLIADISNAITMS
jgi:hypothetical protein